MSTFTRIAARGGQGLGVALILLAVVCHGGVPFHSTAREFPLAVPVALLAGGCLAWLWGRCSSVSGALRRVWRLPFLRFLLLLGGVSLGLNLAVAHWVFDGIPHIDDGVAALFQARIFARGVVTLPLPTAGLFFEQFGVLGARAGLGHWCGMYPPGWSALLCVGVWVGAPWVVAPVLGALLTVSVAYFGRELFDGRTGRIAGLLALPSPFFLVLSGLHLSHIPTGLFCLWGALGLVRALRTGRYRDAVLSGVCWGGALLCRPVTAVVVGGSVGFALVVTQPRRVLRGWGLVVVTGTVTLVGLGLLFLFQHHTTGHFLRPGHIIGLGPRARFGFGGLGDGRAHTVAEGFQYTILRIAALNDRVLGWPVPAMAVAALPFVWRRWRTPYLLLLLPVFGLLGAFSMFWYYEVYFPARYAFAGVPFLVILCARALVLAGVRVRRSRWPWLRPVAVTVVASCVLFTVGFSTPLHLRGYNGHYGDVESVLPRVVRAQGLTHAVVFVDAVGYGLGDVDPNNSYYGTGFMLNDLDLTNDVIYARNSRRYNPLIRQVYPDRSYYLYRYVRDANRACLYRMLPAGDEFRYEPVEPVDPATSLLIQLNPYCTLHRTRCDEGCSAAVKVPRSEG